MGRYERLYASPKLDESVTYVIELPRDEIVRLPGPRTRKLDPVILPISRKRPSSCFVCVFGFLFFLIVIVGIVGGLLFLLFHPRIPKYYVKDIRIQEFDLSRELVVMDVMILAKNPNTRIGIWYKNGSRFWVSYYETVICRGSLPGFYQGHMNTSILEPRLTARGLRFSKELSSSVRDRQNDGGVPLNVDMEFPARIKMRGISNSITMNFTFKVRCKITVTRLLSNQTAQIQSGRSCTLRT